MATRGVKFFASKSKSSLDFALHLPFDTVRIVRRIWPVLSWKNNCRSPLGRDKAAKDVSLRIYCEMGADVIFGGDEGFGDASGLRSELAKI